MKVKVTLEETMKAQARNRGIALDGDGWLTPRPGRFTSEKETQYA